MIRECPFPIGGTAFANRSSVTSVFRAGAEERNRLRKVGCNGNSHRTNGKSHRPVRSQFICGKAKVDIQCGYVPWLRKTWGSRVSADGLRSRGQWKEWQARGTKQPPARRSTLMADTNCDPDTTWMLRCQRLTNAAFRQMNFRLTSLWSEGYSFDGFKTQGASDLANYTYM
jgi:hypothetical protein